MSDTPRIYVACLASYSAGTLHGKWIDLEGKDKDDVQEEVNQVLRSSPFPNVMVEHEGKQVPSAEEWAIHDYDEFPNLGEYPGLDKVMEVASAIEEHGEAYEAYMSMVGTDYATVESFEEAYNGEWDSEKDFAYDLVDSLGMLEGIPESIQNYFNYDAFTRDLFMGDYTSVDLNGKCYVFRS
jgi:antirestriction protein